MRNPLTPERWRQIDDLYQEAAALAPDRRRDLLTRACAGDAELRREVEALLAAESAAMEYFGAVEDYPTVCETTLAEAKRADSTAGPVGPEQAGGWFVRAAVAGLAAVFVIQLSMSALILSDISQDRFGFRVSRDRQGLSVVEIFPGSPAAERLLIGDYLLSINDETRLSRTYPEEVLRRIEPGAACRLLVRRGAQEIPVELSSVPYSYLNLRRVRYLVTCLSRGLIYLVVALLILLLRRNDRFTTIGVLVFGSLAVLTLKQLFSAAGYSNTGWEPWIHLPVLLLYGGVIFIPLSFHLALLFPPAATPPLTGFWRLLRDALYAVMIVLTIPAWVNALAPYHGAAAAILFADEHLWYTLYLDAADWYFILGAGCIVAAHLRSYLALKLPDQRRRIKPVVYGTTAAVSSAVLVALIELIQRYSGSFDSAWVARSEMLASIAGLLAGGMAAAWVYAFLTRRIYDMRIVIWLGLRYLLAKKGLEMLLLAPILGLIYQVSARSDQSVREIFAGQPLPIILFVLVSLSLYFRPRLRRRLDRRFWREPYDQGQVLYRLSDEIKQFKSLPELCRSTSDQLGSVLHPSRVYFLFRQTKSRDLHLSYPPDPALAEAGLPEHSALFQLMRRRADVLEYPSPDSQALPPGEAKLLERLGVTLLTPMLDWQGQLVGLMLLGQKRSEAPYSPTDHRLLLAIARQVATVFEVTQLRQQVERKTRTEWEVLARVAPENVDLLRECLHCGRCFDAGQEECPDCRCSLELTLPIARTIENRYRLERTIGKGGMGAVYRAVDLRLRREVAIKIVNASYFGDQTALRRFDKEARAIAQLSHPNIVKVFDSGRTDLGGAWLVMELVEGATMREELNRHRRLAPMTVAKWFDQLLEGIGAAHRTGIVHRDLKPENVLIDRGQDPEGRVKILDFGLAKMTQMEALGDSSSLTQSGMVVGTPGYMSPEQLEGRPVNERSDLFAIGVMWIEALTGDRPFNGKTLTEQLQAIERRQFRLPDDPGLELIAHRCLAFAPNDRYPTATHLRRVLIAALIGGRRELGF
ncbi:MAG TPA: protein kinase [Blastocatellia bacterium]|nr:protein kinase [Blastocatellia bacterium]